MTFNITQASGPVSHPSSIPPPMNTSSLWHFSLNQNHLGYGLGKIARGTFDYLWHTLHKMWRAEPSTEEVALQRLQASYRHGMEGCTKELIEMLDQHKTSPGSLKRLETLASRCAVYLTPSEDADIRNFQQSLLRPLEEKISKVANPRLQNVLRQWFPTLLQEKSVQESSKRFVQQTGEFPATFDLTTLNGTNGFTMTACTTGGNWLGWSVSSAGDVNQDGIMDLVVGDWHATPGSTSNAGAIYIVFGRKSGWPSLYNLLALNGTDGFIVNGPLSGSNSYFLGYSVRGAGDVNNDGKADIVVGAPGDSQFCCPGSGAAFVIFGQAGGWPAQFNLGSLNGTNGFAVHRPISDSAPFGYDVASAGDLNKDGFGDLIFGVYQASPNGAAYVLFGKASGWPALVDVTSVNGVTGFVVYGLTSSSDFGSPVGYMGDINGDGIDDVLIGAYEGGPGAGYVLFGHSNPWPNQFNLTSLNGSNGFKADGFAGLQELGYGCFGGIAGDINKDGIDDLLLGSDSVGAYAIFGSNGTWGSQFDVTKLNGANGFAVNGISAATADALGQAVAIIGDMSGDGISDFVVGAWGTSPNASLSSAGAAYVVFGQKSGWTALFDLTTLNGMNGFLVNGITVDGGLGRGLNAAGDINGDGFFDLVLGAPPSGTSNCGTAYVIFGMNVTVPPAPTPLSSTFTTSTTPPLSLTPTSSPFPISTFNPSPASTSIASGPSTLRTTSSSISSGIATSSTNPPTPSASSSFALGQTPISTLSIPTSTIPISTISTPGSVSGGGVSNDLAIGLGAGAAGLALIGGLTGLILCLRRRKKTNSASQPLRQRDEEQGLRKTAPESASSLFISSKDLKAEQKIAEGSFGDVYQGLWQNENVAIKQLKAKISSQAEEKLFEEVQVMANLRSPYIVTFFGVTKEQPYRIVMQFMEGGSLREFLKEHTPEGTSWYSRLQISHDIGQGIKYLHDRQIVHADLKSLNVLLDHKRRAKLADFGLATIKTETMGQYYENTGQVKGSLLWMAPELFDKSRHTFATDTYSLGVVLWEIASHRLPFEDRQWGVGNLIAKVTQGEREKFPKGTPKNYAKLAEQCWDGDPKKRPTAEKAAQILSELQQEKQTDKIEDSESVSSEKPAYLTGTDDLPSDRKKKDPKKSAYLDNDATKFGM